MEANKRYYNSYYNQNYNYNYYQNNTNTTTESTSRFSNYKNYKYRNNYGFSNNQKPWQFENKKSHFINIPIEDEFFISEYTNLMDEIKNRTLKDFYPELLQKSGKLHMTICVLELGDDEEKIQKVHKLLKDLNPEIIKIAKGKVNFNLENFDTMGPLTQARVIYAKMVEDDHFSKISEIIHIIIKTLVDNDILEKEKLSESHIELDEETNKYKIKLHMTLLNVLFLNKILKKRRMKQVYNIDASEIMEYMNSKSLPTAEITSIHFSRMREDKQTEKYEMLYSYKII
jgi:hypothetical protein